MNLFPLSFLKEYLYSPKTWLHRIVTSKKIGIIFLNLMFLPYASLNYLLSITVMLLIILITLQLPRRIFRRFILSILFILICTFVANVNTHLAHKLICTTIELKITIPKLSIHNTLCLRKIKSTDSICIQIDLPQYLARAGFISITYVSYLQFVSLTTLHEDLILCFYIPIAKAQNNIRKDFSVILSIAYQVLEILAINIENILIAIKVRGLHPNGLNNWQNQTRLYYSGYTTFLILFNQEIKQMTSALYAREISDKQLFIADLDI